ncbi:ubinuclein-2-like isoform X2 [Myxocyprinus asiaticus]|uniref:ubinuclein-2-like isoform X2 n=1 Tax=Myxocyprinus asiaticus TaxID=70543 RepID=UPI002223115A|nr:ubinuclein-2-like isoform X2 [Myxocyprinus asiaticus]
MAEPRKVQFVTLSALAGGQGAEGWRRRLEEDGAAEMSFDREGRMKMTGTGVTAPAGDRGGLIGKRDGDEPKGKKTVRLNLCLSEPNEQCSAEFNYSELIQSQQAKKNPPGSMSSLDLNNPFNDDERERLEVEALAKKFESKYGNAGKKRRKDRMQDLIDIGFGYDESDPFIDNSEAVSGLLPWQQTSVTTEMIDCHLTCCLPTPFHCALNLKYDELVPASLTTKLGGFYINTGTLQFRAASESEGEEGAKDEKSRMRDGEEPLIKRRKTKDVASVEDKKPRRNNVAKQGVAALNLHRPEKKKRKKLMKDSLCLAAMLRRFTREKEEMRKRDPNASHLGPGLPSTPSSNNLPQNSHLHGNANNDLPLAELTADPAMMSLLGSANESELQDLMRDLDFSFLDAVPQMPPSGRENGQIGVGSSAGHKIGGGGLSRGQGGLISPPPLPDGLPAPLIKRIEDLRAASRQFDQEGRKKFFTLDMNNILLDIELQVQEQPADVRSQVYSHLEAFVPCNKEALLKRLKKLSLNIQDDRLRTPLLKLKLAVCSVMPEQIARYNMDCMAKAASKHQTEEAEKNGSEDDDEEKPGKRVMGPRKKFIWDDKLRTLLCNLVRVKLSCYELEQCSLSVEDYLKSFMENEVKPLWPKGWMQARMLFKESRGVHGHLTGLGRKRIVTTPKAAKMTEVGWTQRPAPGVGTTSASPALPAPACILPSSPSEPICLSDSLDEDLAANSLDSISQALALLSNAAKGLTSNNGVPASSPGITGSSSGVSHYSSPLSHSTLPAKMEPSGVSLANMNSLSTSPSLSSPFTSSPSSSIRGETFGLLKDSGSLQRHLVTPTHRAGLNVGQSAKPRPPPTASPLLPPQQRSFGVMGVKQSQTPHPIGQVKNCGNKSGTGVNGISGTVVSQQPRMNTHPSQMNAKSPQQSRVPNSPPLTPSSPSTLLLQAKTPTMPHSQSNFITPMQATLTKSSHSSSSPIIKLTPRPPAPTPPPSSSPSPSLSPSPTHPRPQMITSPHQYIPKSPGFRPPFTAQGSGVKSGSGQASYSFAGGQKSTSPSSGGSGNTITTPMAKPLSASVQDCSPSASAVPANHTQRQRTVGGTSQSAKSSTSRASAMTLPSPPVSNHLAQGSTSSGSNLLGSVPPSLPLGFGMLGGLVPVSLPFQFPSLLNFNPTGPGVPGCSNMGASPTTNSGYTLAQNANQSQGGDTKRKPH